MIFGYVSVFRIVMLFPVYVPFPYGSLKIISNVFVVAVASPAVTDESVMYEIICVYAVQYQLVYGHLALYVEPAHLVILKYWCGELDGGLGVFNYGLIVQSYLVKILCGNVQSNVYYAHALLLTNCFVAGVLI